ncbi:hypothetical protein BW247_11940 [Acidihalobacter ferrooxydans]|uniref:Uncharacterized protein n=1 Tax=Acidihalobacter ferrooxydans TaxID=1765967 RepID=A0A1P8ULJ0_9GAMM|nr:hypothetical protein BW247_11940 [Acidihalobacter ferrooxydans]
MAADRSTRNDAACAVTIEGIAHNGKPCRIVDNTGTVARAELESLLAELIEQRRFGLSGRSLAGGSSIRIGEPEFTHIQLGDDLYRFILLPYEARIEAF